MASPIISIGALIFLGLTIWSSYLLYGAIHESASSELTDLKTSTNLAQIKLISIVSRAPDIVNCSLQVSNNTAKMQNCSMVTSSLIQQDVELINNKTLELAQNNVDGFNSTVTSIIEKACDRLAVLNEVVNTTVAIPFDVQNGTVLVQLVGGNSFSVPYFLKQLKLNELRMVYLSLEPWPHALSTNTSQVNPIFKFTSFVPPIIQPNGPSFAKPFTTEQSGRFVWSNNDIKATSYTWDGDLNIHSNGNSSQSDTVFLQGSLSVVMQFL